MQPAARDSNDFQSVVNPKAGVNIARSHHMSDTRAPDVVDAPQRRHAAAKNNRRPVDTPDVAETSARTRAWSSVVALTFLAAAMWGGYTAIGLPPVVIVGGSGMAAFVIWQRSYLRRPVDPSAILPLFLLTVAALDVHMAEEYLARFGPAMSRLFDVSWTERSFLLIFAFVGPCLYALTAIGLYYRIPLAGFLAWFIFIGPGVAEFTHFIFPLLRPALAPAVAAAITAQVSNGHLVAEMPNYWIGVTGRYYFPGLYTAVLPMVPGIYAIVRLAGRTAASRPSAGPRAHRVLPVVLRGTDQAAAHQEEIVTRGEISQPLTRRERAVYRASTGLVLAVMLFSIVNFVFNDRFPFPNGSEGAFSHLGFPPYFKAELTVAKILGVLALLVPAIPIKVKEFAYAGFAITLVSAAIAHFGRGDARNLSVLYVVDPLVFFCLLGISYYYFNKSHSLDVAMTADHSRRA
jgi:hypothetical protein